MIDPAASRGQPSVVWRAGQDRRLAMIAAAAPAGAAAALDVGCGLGMYTAQLAERCGLALGLEVEWARARAARRGGLRVTVAVSERLPFRDGAFDLVLLHEVLEHVADDRVTAQEVARVLAPAGRAVIFVPNRWWPFETHGLFWRGHYRFGNIPLLNYLPDPARNRLAPHVRVYTARGLRALFDDLPVRVVRHTQVFPGYDNLAARRPCLGHLTRRLTYALEATPVRRFGLSHLLILERSPEPAAPPD
jgi:SAM-dependent methyltransferase